MVKVSCIITTHNRLELLNRAVESVLSQTYKNYELIIVDDASDDSTKEWCIQIEANYPNKVKYIRIEKKDSKGGNYARNLGIKNAAGEYLAFLDDDDEWLPSKLDKQVAVMNENEDCVLVYGNRIIENVDSKGGISYKQLPFTKKYSGDVSKDILTDIFTTTSLILTRKSAVEEVGLFDENLKFWQEYELSIRLAQIGEFLYVDEPLIRYRVNIFDNSRLTNKYYEWRKAVKYVRSKHRRLYDSLSSYYKLKSIALIWDDASHRTRTCGLAVKSFVYKNLYKSFRIIAAIHDGLFLKKMKTRLHLLPLPVRIKKKHARQGIKLLLEYKPIKYCVSALRKLHFPIDKPYYSVIHKEKKKRIKSYIPQSLEFLKSETVNMYGDIDIKTLPIYILWLQGKENLPPIVNLCVKSIEHNRSNHPIIYIDQNNLKSILDSLPEHGQQIYDWYRNGIITIQYLSDILRAGILSERGGIWTDATLFLTSSIDDILLNPHFYSFKRSRENINWKFVSENRWTAFFLAAQKNNLLMSFLYKALIECIKNYRGIPDYWTIDYILAIAYEESQEVKDFIDKLPSIQPNLGMLFQLERGIDNETFKKIIKSSPAFKLDWRRPVREWDENGNPTIYTHIKKYLDYE